MPLAAPTRQPKQSLGRARSDHAREAHVAEKNLSVFQTASFPSLASRCFPASSLRERTLATGELIHSFLLGRAPESLVC